MLYYRYSISCMRAMSNSRMDLKTEQVISSRSALCCTLHSKIFDESNTKSICVQNNTASNAIIIQQAN